MQTIVRQDFSHFREIIHTLGAKIQATMSRLRASQAPKWVSTAKTAATALAFTGAVMLSSPSLGLAITPFALFGACHLLWAAASIRQGDVQAIALNVALLPFDLLSVLSRV